MNRNALHFIPYPWKLVYANQSLSSYNGRKPKFKYLFIDFFLRYTILPSIKRIQLNFEWKLTYCDCVFFLWILISNGSEKKAMKKMFNVYGLYKLERYLLFGMH